MIEVLERGQKVVDSAKDYLPQINLYGKLFDLSKAEARLLQQDIAKFEKQLPSIRDEITQIERKFADLKGSLNEVDNPEWLMS